MCSIGRDAHSSSHSESLETLTDFSLCELAGEVESLIRARYPLRSLRQFLQQYPCEDFDTNRASAVAWLKKLSDTLKVQQGFIGIKSSYVLVPSVDVSRASVPQRSLREGTGFLRSCSHCGSALMQLDSSCPVCQRVDSSPSNFEGKLTFAFAPLVARARDAMFRCFCFRGNSGKFSPKRLRHV
jgi:hypothetical protein